MKIFNIRQIRNCDEYTITHESISSLQLMERAAKTCTDWISVHLKNFHQFYIFCGNGNNGGDGFAIARMLYLKGNDVTVFVDKLNPNFSKDAQENYTKIKELSGISILDFNEIVTINFPENSLIIDAVFGSGLNRKIEGKIEKLIQFLNQIKCKKIAIDIPSGLFADENLPENSPVFFADETLTFQFWKKSFLHPETGVYCGKVHVLDIGLSPKFIEETTTLDFTIDEDFISEIYKPRKSFSHKGNYGKACIVAGSFGKIGAAVLATKSALRAGSGLTYILAPRCGYEILQTTCPEAMFLYGGEDFITRLETEKEFVCGIGPGLGTDSETEEVFLEFLKNHQKPLVLDADALNIIAKNKAETLIPENSIITPHPKEFERLFGKTENSFERLNLAKEKASELKIFIVLKDHHTQIVTPNGNVFYNVTGNSGMAKGGSGDVLMGIITALLAQNYNPEEAAVFGVWLHGKAGDFAAEKHSHEAMLPSDLTEEIGNVFKFLQKNYSLT